MLNNRDNRGQYRPLMTGTMHLHVPGSLGHCCVLSLGDTGSLRVGPSSFLTLNALPLALRQLRPVPTEGVWAKPLSSYVPHLAQTLGKVVFLPKIPF